MRDIESIVASFTGCGGRLQLRDTIPPDAFDARSLSDGKRFSILQVGFDDFHGMRACLQEQLPEQARGICRREPVLLGAAMLGFDAIGLDVDPLPAFRQGSPDRFRSPFSCTNDSDSHRFTLTHTQNHDRIRASFVSRFSRRPPPMNDRWMKFVVVCVLVAAWGGPAASQSTFVKASIAIENVRLQTASGVLEPLPVPVSAPVRLVPPCGAVSFGTLSMNVVDNGIDVAVEGSTFDCGSAATLHFDVVIQVPVVSLDAVAFISVVSEVGEVSLTNSPYISGERGIASLLFESSGSGATSAAFPGQLKVDLADLSYGFRGDPTEVSASGMTSIFPLIPGDEVRIPMSLRVRLDPPTGGGNLEGAFDVRFEFQTRLPLPVSGLSPSISIPIGVMGLTGLARLRG